MPKSKPPRKRLLSKNHAWKAAPGNKIFVADRGAMQFEYPRDWVISFGESGSIRFFDKEEADADMRLEVSLIYVPPIDWSGLSLSQLVDDTAVSHDHRGLTGHTPYQEMKRANLEAAWLEASFHDPGEDRKAHTRICMARGPGAYALITMEFWPEHAARGRKVWKNVLDSLKLDANSKDRLTLDGHHRPIRPARN